MNGTGFCELLRQYYNQNSQPLYNNSHFANGFTKKIMAPFHLTL
jgi:hypothetical protein